MNKIIKEYKGVVLFYLLIVISIFIISQRNANLEKKNDIKSVTINQIAFNK